MILSKIRQLKYTEIIMDTFQVPVIDKTEAIFTRNPHNVSEVLHKLNPKLEVAIKENANNMIVSVKTDGTCGMIVKLADNKYWLLVRRDIKKTSHNYGSLLEFGKLYSNIAGKKCFVSQIFRSGIQNKSINCPIYFFDIDESGNPSIDEGGHLVGFTPIICIPEDKWLYTVIVGSNGSDEMLLYTTVGQGIVNSSTTKLDIEVKLVPIDKIMNGQLLMTVELMGSKIANRYGFTSNQHFINPHGSIVIPTEFHPKFDFDSFVDYFTHDKRTVWANNEGIVVHFISSKQRFKLHVGHVGLEKTWKNKKESGINFIFIKINE